MAFQNAIGSPNKASRQRLKLRASVLICPGVTPYTLRRTFASRLALAGVDLSANQKLAEWEGSHMLRRYAHLSPTINSQAVEEITNHFPTLFTTPNQPASDVPGIEC